MVNRYFDQTVSFATTDGATKYSFNVAYDEESGARRYRVRQRPSQDGDPDRPFRMDFPFGYQGWGSNLDRYYEDTYAVAADSDARARGLLYPPMDPEQVTFSTSPNGTVRSIWVAHSPDRTAYIYVGGGTRVRKLLASDNSDIDGTTLAVTEIFGAPAAWGGYWWLGANVGYRLTVGNGAGTDVWTAMNTGGNVEVRGVTAAVLTGSTTPVLIRGQSTGQISTASSDPTVLANWSSLYAIAPTNQPVNTILTHDGNIYVASSAGLYAVDPNVNGTPLTENLVNAATITTGINSIVWHGKIFYPSAVGLFRIRGGFQKSVGPEVVPSPARVFGRVTAMAGFPNWLYVAVYDGTNSHIFAGRERESVDPPGDSEMVWHCFRSNLVGEIGAMAAFMGSDTVSPRLYYGLGAAVWYVRLGKNGGLLPGDTGPIYDDAMSHTFAPNDLGRPETMKVAETIEVWYQNYNLNATLAVKFQWDEETSATQVATTASTGFLTLTLTPGTNDRGRWLRPQVTIASSHWATPSYLKRGSMVVRGRERPDQVREVNVAVMLTEGGVEIPQGKTVQELRTQLFSWRELGTALVFTDNYTGETFTCRIQDVEAMETNSDVGNYPAYQVAVRLVESLN